MRYYVTFPTGEEIPVEVDHLPTGEVAVVVNGKRLAADVVTGAGSTTLRIDNHVVDLVLEGAPPGVGVVARGHRFYAKAESERLRALAAALGSKSGASAQGTVVSPMPGRVLKVLVTEGADVDEGAPLVVVEAMKMENELVAPHAGKVKKIHVTPGQTVESGAKLVEVE
jgi:biotin carboxyl carrier protein